jgi:hypothetical protein
VYKQGLWGLLEYKPQWTISLKGWLLLLIINTIILFVVLTRIQPFLALQSPIQPADAILLEGWVGDPIIAGAAKEFQQGNYKLIITTGTDIYRGSWLSEYKNYADLSAATLTNLGIPAEKIVSLASPNTKKDRTAAAALTVKQWLEENDANLNSINIYSFDVHTRRSWWIYKKVFGPRFQVGAIAHPNIYYESQRWWESSAGFRSVTEEALAYVYARFFWYN